MTYALELCFDGAAYHGWQIQKNAVTVQETLFRAITRATGEEPYPELAGCGRTDAGVSAAAYVASFRTHTTIPPERFPLAIHRFLPGDVSVRRAAAVPDGFHARFSCLKKEHVYRLYHDVLPHPFLRGRAAWHCRPLDVAAMAAAAERLVGTHDFTAFCASGGSVRDHVRTVLSCRVTGTQDRAEIRVAADGFLYNMVRIIAGTLLYVSDEKLTAEDVSRALGSRDRTLAGVTLPACGLTLERVWYGDRPGLDGIGPGVRLF